MTAPSNTFCYIVLEAVIKSEVEQEITEILQVIQCVNNLAEFYFTADFRLTKFCGDYGASNFLRRIFGGHNIWRRMRRLAAAEMSTLI